MGDTADESQATRDPLYVSTRAQLNFIENVPLALIVALIAELNGANRYVLHLFPHPSPQIFRYPMLTAIENIFTTASVLS